MEASVPPGKQVDETPSPDQAVGSPPTPKREPTRLPLKRGTLVAIWAAGWSAAMVVMVGNAWMHVAVRGVSLFSEWYYAPRAISSVLIGAVLSVGVFSVLNRLVTPVRPLTARVLRYVPIGVGYWLAWSLLAAGLRILVWPGPPTTLGLELRNAVAAFAFDALLIFAVMAAIFEVMLNGARVSREETRTARYAAEVSRAQSAALAAQLDPHFLFNTLHVASGLMGRDVNAARRVLRDLRGLLNQSFQREGRRLVQLGDEVRLVERYLRIQQARFGERLDVRLHVDAEASDAHIPPLLIQPLVENAIQHGIAGQREGGWIRIEVRRDGEAISVIVENSGPAGRPGSDRPISERIGLGGVRARLHAVFGDAAGLHIRHDPSGTFTATVTLPSVAVESQVESQDDPPPPNRDPAGAGITTSDQWNLEESRRSRPWGWPRWFAIGTLLYLGVAVHYHVVLGVRRVFSGLPFYSSWEQLVPAGSLFLIEAVLTPPAVLLLWTVRRRIRRIPPILVLYISVGLASWGALAFTAYHIRPLVAGGGSPLTQILALTAFVSLARYTVVALLVEAAWQLHMARQAAMDAAALRADLLAAETAALRSRVSPNLLFGSLALALDVMRDDIRAARRVLSDAGELLRVSLGREGEPFVPLTQELDYLRRVLDIQVGRGRGRAPVHLDLAGGAGDRMIPRLALQPLAEEVARCAVETGGTLARILIRGEVDGPDRVRLSVRVDPEGSDGGTAHVRLSGAQLDQVREWLATAYGCDPGIVVDTSPDGTTSLVFMAPVAVSLPHRRASRFLEGRRASGGLSSGRHPC